MECKESSVPSPPTTTPNIHPAKAGKGYDTVEFYRDLIQTFIERHDYESALYWADKVASLSNTAQQDVYLVAQCMFHCGQYQRAANYLQHHKYERTNLYFRVLAARCLLKAGNYNKALDVLDVENQSVKPGQRVKENKWEPKDPHKSIMGQVYLLKGKIYEALTNRILASQNYKLALQHDVYCYEALRLLTQHHMLSRNEELALLQSIRFEQKCLNNDTDLVKYVYTTKVKKYAVCGEPALTTNVISLKKNMDVLATNAERHFYNCDFPSAYKLTSQVISEDPYHMSCLPVYIACLVELNKATELFRVAHKLIEVMSDSALAWYAVGSYYFLIGKHESARRNLNKSLSIDPVFGPAWLLFGHSFATESEHDQAMAAYFKATQLMKGCHLPMLHVGLECGLSNNPQLAMKFLEEAKLLAPFDPFIRHEMGVVKFHEKKYDEAHQLFRDTLSMIQTKPTQSQFLKKWEPLYNNLGHVSRKLGRYTEAYGYHQKALVLCPSNASTHAAIGLVLAVSGKTEKAIEAFHKALSLKRDDAFSNTMLRYVVEKMVEESNSDDFDNKNNADSLLSDDSEDLEPSFMPQNQTLLLFDWIRPISKTMDFDLNIDPEALNLSEISTMLDSPFNVSRENASMCSSNSTLCGNSLETLEGSSIWSPSAHNSSDTSYNCPRSPATRSFENNGIWSPHFYSSSGTSFSSNSPPERLADGITGSSIWSPHPSSPHPNSSHPSSPSTHNSSSTFSHSSSSPPPGLASLAHLGLQSKSANLNVKQTIQALNFLQDLQEGSNNSSWENGRSSENSSLTAVLRQHLITHLLQQTPPSPTNDNLLRSVRMHRENAGMTEARCTWSGQLPPRNHKNPIYSCKVFLGGVPYEVSISTLLRTFRAYGNVKIDWPGKEDNPSAPKGYAYLIYENERQVKALLQNCIYHYGKESTWYYKISSKRLRFHSKDIQVIPWAISDSNFVRCQTTKLDPQKTIFVGALHGMINAEGLAYIMQELFGGVVYAGIDTDRHKYPIGSARLTFNNHKSYMKAVSAEFIEIRTSKFTKKVQVDPYLEDATCSVCALQQGPYFCRSLSCFRYFCRTCFECQHAGEAFQSHRPLTRNASRQPGASAPVVP
ncbi:unnamed protein product [Allacma fusca]|uniref:RRM domain-containing protein n=1 Tax=Allacma fusca TaxID=39272 RepID=A0A8J2NVA2_9HEXA|nr:unnamed protein product [Allacma fusca]